MTISHKRSKNGNYYINCMTADDYYSNNGGKEPPGVWHFSGRPEQRAQAEKLFGLVNGQVFAADDTEAFESLVKGFNPDTGEKLTQNAGEADRLALHDFTFSAPKSFSVVWSQLSDETRHSMQDAQATGVRAGIGLMSRKAAFSRQGKGGLIKSEVGLITSLFEHGSSRENDPQLHTHGVILNVGIRPDGTTGSIETRDMMQWQGAAASIYHATLAWEARQMGAQIRMNGKIPEIEGIPHAVARAFSQRRQQIEAAVEAAQVEAGMTADVTRANRGLVQKAVIETRDAKNELTRAELQALWVERGQALGFTEAEALEVLTLGEPVVELTAVELLAAARRAVAALTETDATFYEPALYTAVAVELCGQADAGAIDRAVEAMKRELVYANEIVQRKQAVTLGSGPPTDGMIALAGEIEERRLLIGAEPILTPEMLESFAEVRQYLDAYSEKVIGLQTRDPLAPPEIRQVFSTQEMVLCEADLVRRAGEQSPEHRLDADVVRAAIAERDAQIRAAVAADLKAKGLDAEDAAGLEAEQRNAIEHACLSDASISVIEGTAGAGKTFSATTVAEIYKSQGYAVHGLSAAWAQALNLRDEAKLDSGRAIAGWLNDVRKGRLALDARSVLVVDEAGMIGARQLRHVIELAQDAGAKVVLLGDTKQQGSVAAGVALSTIVAVTGSARLDTVRRQTNAAERAAVPLFFNGRAKEALEAYAGRIAIENGRDATQAQLIADWQTSRQAHSPELDAKLNSHLILALDRATVRELNLRAHEALREAGELGADALCVRTIDSQEHGDADEDLIEFRAGDEVQIRANSKDDLVFNRTAGRVERVNLEAGTFDIRMSDGRAINIDPQDERWQDSDGRLALQYGYATTINASQGLTRGRLFVHDHVGLDRRTAGVAMSRHREDCRVYVDREARHAAMMKAADATEWRHINSFSDEECLGRIATAWSRESDKSSTLDHDEWMHVSTDERLYVNEALFVDTIDRYAEREHERPAPELLPFQRAADYELKLPPAPDLAAHRSREQLVDAGISPAVIADAERAGFLTYQPRDGANSGEPLYVGSDAGGRALNAIDGAGAPAAAAATGALRDRVAPVLPGDPGHVVVAPSGADALAAWQNADAAGQPRPTVIVASAPSQLAARAQLLGQAKRVEVTPSPQAAPLASAVHEAAKREQRDVDVSVVDEEPRRQAAAAAQRERERVEQEEQRRRIERSR